MLKCVLRSLMTRWVYRGQACCYLQHYHIVPMCMFKHPETTRSYGYVVQTGAATIVESPTFCANSTLFVQVALCVLEGLASANNLCREAIVMHGGVPVLLQVSLLTLRRLDTPSTRPCSLSFIPGTSFPLNVSYAPRNRIQCDRSNLLLGNR